MSDTTAKLTGGKVNYYLVQVAFPQREEQAPYQAECEDIAEALQLTPNEFNIFKAIWRSAAARIGNGKPDHKAQYDAEKIVHYAQRNLRSLLIAQDKYQRPEPKEKGIDADGWQRNLGYMPHGLSSNTLIEARLAPGSIVTHVAGDLVWELDLGVATIIKWRRA